MGAMDGPGIFVEGFVTGKPWKALYLMGDSMVPGDVPLNQSSVSIAKSGVAHHGDFSPPGASSLEVHLFHHSDLLRITRHFMISGVFLGV